MSTLDVWPDRRHPDVLISVWNRLPLRRRCRTQLNVSVDVVVHGSPVHDRFLGVVAMIGSFGTAQILILAFVVLLLFGKRLPSTMRSIGESFREFRRGLRSADDVEGSESM